jgi:hypothetical protein
MDKFDAVWLPKWLDRRGTWTANRDQRRLLRAERAIEKPPKGKDATKGWWGISLPSCACRSASV